MKDNRPVNLDFTTFKLPLPAIVSILHRITGAFLFFGMALFLYLLDLSLSSPEGFNEAAQWLGSPLSKIVVLLLVAALIYHLVAGIKHLLMDMGIGESLEGGQLGARLVLIIAVIATIAVGVRLW